MRKWDLHQSTSLAESQKKNLEARGCKPWVTTIIDHSPYIRYTNCKYYVRHNISLKTLLSLEWMHTRLCVYNVISHHLVAFHGTCLGKHWRKMLGIPEGMLAVDEKRMHWLAWPQQKSHLAKISPSKTKYLQNSANAHNLQEWEVSEKEPYLLETSTMSPGTSSFALIGWGPSLPFRMTLAISGSYSLRASMADSAFLSWKK